jgi:hypothetical protein
MIWIAYFSTSLLLAAASAVADDAIDDAPTVILEREPGGFGGPVYTVSVTPAGEVVFEGRSGVHDPGTHRATVSTHDVTRLIEALGVARFDELRNQYLYQTDGCERVGTDARGLSITVVRGTRRKLVTCYLGCEGGPAARDVAAIEQLGNRIDEILGTARWVYPKAPTSGSLPVEKLRK